MLAKKFTNPEFWSSSSRTWRETGKQSRPWLKIGTFVFVAWPCVSIVWVPYPDRHAQHLVPLWVGVFLQDLCADLRKKAKTELGSVVLSCVPECWRRFQDITRTVLPAKWISTSGSTRFFLLLSNPSICLIPSMKASSTADSKRARNISISSSLKKIIEQWTVSGFTLWQVFSSEDLQGKRCSSKRQSSRS